MIVFACAGCGSSFHVKDEFAGKRTTCPKCGQAINVPASSWVAKSISPILEPPRLPQPPAPPVSVRSAAPNQPQAGSDEATQYIVASLVETPTSRRLRMEDIVAIGIGPAIIATMIAVPCLLLIGIIIDVFFAVILFPRPGNPSRLICTILAPFASPIFGPLAAARINKDRRLKKLQQLQSHEPAETQNPPNVIQERSVVDHEVSQSKKSRSGQRGKRMMIICFSSIVLLHFFPWYHVTYSARCVEHVRTSFREFEISGDKFIHGVEVKWGIASLCFSIVGLAASIWISRNTIRKDSMVVNVVNIAAIGVIGFSILGLFLIFTGAGLKLDLPEGDWGPLQLTVKGIPMGTIPIAMLALLVLVIAWKMPRERTKR